MKTKFLLPVLAIIFATGMSFTTVELGDKVDSDYIRVNNQWMPVPEVDCKPGPEICKVELSDGSIHYLYETRSLSSRKESNTTIPFEL